MSRQSRDWGSRSGSSRAQARWNRNRLVPPNVEGKLNGLELENYLLVQDLGQVRENAFHGVLGDVSGAESVVGLHGNAPPQQDRNLRIVGELVGAWAAGVVHECQGNVVDTVLRRQFT